MVEETVLDEDLGTYYLGRAGVLPESTLGIARLCTFAEPQDRWYALDSNSSGETGDSYPIDPIVEGVLVFHAGTRLQGGSGGLPAPACPARRAHGAADLGADVRGLAPGDAGAALAEALVTMMRDTEIPLGLEPLGYTAADVAMLAPLALAQRRLVDNAPRAVSLDEMRALFDGAMSYGDRPRA